MCDKDLYMSLSLYPQHMANTCVVNTYVVNTWPTYTWPTHISHVCDLEKKDEDTLTTHSKLTSCFIISLNILLHVLHHNFYIIACSVFSVNLVFAHVHNMPDTPIVN